MTNRRLIILCAILAALLITACGGPEEKKMKFFNKGKALYDQGDYVSAKLEFRNALQIDRSFAEGYYMWGLIELHERNLRKAYGLFFKAVELDPDLLDAQAALGRIMIAAQQTDEAKQKIELVLARDPNHEEALLGQANLLLAEDMTEEPRRILESIIDKNPKKAEAYLMLSDMQMNHGDMGGARLTLERLLDQDKQNETARIHLIRIFEKEGDFEEAEDAYRDLIALDPENHTFKLMLAGFYVRTARSNQAEKVLKDLMETNPDEIEPRIHLARFYKHRQRDQEMAAVLQKAIADLPDQFSAYQMLGAHYVNIDQEEKAIALMGQFVRTVQTGPAVLKAKLFVAETYYKERELDKALEFAEAVLEENPADMNAHSLKGSILAIRGDFPGAISEFRAVIRQEPQNIQVSLSLARAHLLNKETSLAEDLYKKILELDPTESRARFGMADVYKRKGNISSAKRELEMVLELNPNDTEALMALGDLALSQQDVAAAQEYFSRLAALQPNSEHYNQYKKGMVKLIERKAEEAAVLFEKALEADPDFVPALNQLVRIRLKEEQRAKAIRRCREQIARRPENSTFHVLLGRLLVLDGDNDGARKSFEEALRLDPNSPDAVFRLAELEQSIGSLDDAILRYQALRERYPDSLGIEMVLATLLERNGDFSGAKSLYEHILKRNPNVYVAANNLAFYYAEHDPTVENLAEGKRLMLPLLRRFANNANFVDTAAWVFYRQGNFVKARDLLLSVEDKIENRPTMQYHLGMIYLGLDQKVEARKHLELAIRSNQNFTGRKDAEKAFKELS